MEINEILPDIYDDKNWTNHIAIVSYHWQAKSNTTNPTICPTCSFESIMHISESIYFCKICRKYYNTKIYNIKETPIIGNNQSTCCTIC